MARPLNNGVTYFPKDTDFYSDDKVRLLRSEFGAKGMYLLDYILCELYRKDGYFMKWDQSKCCLVSDGAGCGCSPSFVQELIGGCIRCGIFDRTVFEKHAVLTSAGIQRRYVRMFNGRDYIRLVNEYFLLDISDSRDITRGILEKCVFTGEKNNKIKENPDKIKENPDKFKVYPQSKVKESKVNKSKVKAESGSAPFGCRSGERLLFGSFKNVRLTAAEREDILSRYGSDVGNRLIDVFSDRLKVKGYRISDHYSTIISWAEQDGVRQDRGSYDTEEFFSAAVERTKKELEEEGEGK